jgi:uncharacterized protein (TIGR02391 family)
MEPVNLSEQQRLYLQTIFDHLHAYGKWPTDKYLEKNLFQTCPGLDAEQVLGSFSVGELINVSSYADGHVEVSLTVPATRLCYDAEDDLLDFVQAVRFFVRTHFTSETDLPQISSDDLRSQLSMSELSVRKIGQLLRSEPNIYTGFTFHSNWLYWRCKILKDVRRFRGIETIEQYLARRDISAHRTKLTTSQTANESPKISPAVGSVEELQIHPDIRSKCWGLYINGKYDEAILNATKALEVAVRTKAKLPENCVGIDVINTAFSLKKPLLRYSTIEAEQEGMMSLLRGMIQVFKNPHSHRFVGVQSKTECLSVMLMCSNLLYVIDNAEYTGVD